MKKIIVIGVLLLTLGGCHKNEIEYQQIEVVQKDLQKKVEANGSVETTNTVDIYAPVSGRLEELFVQEGDLVKSNQKIGTMSSDNRSAIIDMATSKGPKEVAYWKSQLLLTPMYAPVDGKVILLKVRNKGEKVSGSIGQISTGEMIRANIDENDLLGLELGKEVEIQFDINPKSKLTGKLDRISQTSKLVNNVNVYEVEIVLPSEKEIKKLPFDMKIGMSVTLHFPVHEKKGAKALPINSVNGKSMTNISVLKSNDTRAKVKLGDVYGDYVEVQSGLELGEKIKVPVFKNSKKARKSPLMMNSN